MKIVLIDNYGRDYISDILVAENVPECYATELAEYLNKRYSDATSRDFFIVKDDDYELWTFEP